MTLFLSVGSLHLRGPPDSSPSTIRSLDVGEPLNVSTSQSYVPYHRAIGEWILKPCLSTPSAQGQCRCYRTCGKGRFPYKKFISIAFALIQNVLSAVHRRSFKPSLPGHLGLCVVREAKPGSNLLLMPCLTQKGKDDEHIPTLFKVKLVRKS